LADLIRIAYRVKAYQVQGPDWMAQQRFEIQAKIPEGVPEDKVPEMLQALLADRFKLTIHRDKKELPVYALIVGKNGSKLTEASSEPDVPLPRFPRRHEHRHGKGPHEDRAGRQGGSVMQGGGYAGTIKQSDIGRRSSHRNEQGNLHLYGGAAHLPGGSSGAGYDGAKGKLSNLAGSPHGRSASLARKQAAALGIDMPGPPPGANPADAASTPGGSAIFTAMEKLGLKLDGRKAPIETIVVDRLEKTPTDN